MAMASWSKLFLQQLVANSPNVSIKNGQKFVLKTNSVCCWRAFSQTSTFSSQKEETFKNEELIGNNENVLTEEIKKKFEIKDIHYEFVRQQEYGALPLHKFTPSKYSTKDYIARKHMRFGGLKFEELPICLIHAKYNNTFVTVCNSDFKTISFMTCGKAGFKNAKQSTPHAAETVGKMAAEMAIHKDCPHNVRVLVKGFGQGRRPAMKGVMLGGMNIVSITDKTPLFWQYKYYKMPQRPRKIRRL